MATDEMGEVYRQHRTAQEKYVYFLLAVVGAAIALVVNQTQEARITWSQTPLALAVLLWGISFYFGCCQLAAFESVMMTNMTLLKVQGGFIPEIGNNPQAIAYVSNRFVEDIRAHSDRATRFGKLQFWCLVGGAVAYLIWHVYGMWLRSVVVA